MAEMEMWKKSKFVYYQAGVVCARERRPAGIFASA
jgi:hypothetical protein|tara:strand:- start:742 stop:846 length:105 start_codon:yes stop_codon:yes gene_type:complete